MAHFAIVGAGAAGLAAAFALQPQPINCTIFEKSRGYTGRAATRGRREVRYDHGANYIKPTSPRVRRLITEVLPTDQLEDIDGAIWTFDQDGTLAPGEDRNEPQWTYRSGISTLGKLLVRTGQLTVETETRIERLDRRRDGWRLIDDEHSSYGPFDGVLLTPPAPQTADLLAASALPDAFKNAYDALSAVAYDPQFSYVLGYDRRLKRPGDFYAAVNTDKAHDVAWIAYENDKPGHVPSGHSTLVIQMAPHWTTQRVDSDPDDFFSDAKEKAADVLGIDLRRPAWYDTQRWRYALPTAAADRSTLHGYASDGLFFAGDYVAGKGRVGLALDTGFDAALRITDALS